MAKVNLKSVGYNVDVDLQGTVEVHPEQAPVVVRLAEAHNDNKLLGPPQFDFRLETESCRKGSIRSR
jgi:hypothetical protein